MISKALYQVVTFFARWLAQPTIIKVADSIEAKPTNTKR
jgi:hypothetical protein